MDGCTIWIFVSCLPPCSSSIIHLAAQDRDLYNSLLLIQSLSQSLNHRVLPVPPFTFSQSLLPCHLDHHLSLLSVVPFSNPVPFPSILHSNQRPVLKSKLKEIPILQTPAIALYYLRIKSRHLDIVSRVLHVLASNPNLHLSPPSTLISLALLSSSQTMWILVFYIMALNLRT
jgi:hypothetical protein